MNTLEERRSQAGQALAEFAMILAMVAVILLVVVLFLSGKLLIIQDALGK
jgi:Flp pilus assembly pilin Flp